MTSTHAVPANTVYANRVDQSAYVHGKPLKPDALNRSTHSSSTQSTTSATSSSTTTSSSSSSLSSVSSDNRVLLEELQQSDQEKRRADRQVTDQHQTLRSPTLRSRLRSMSTSLFALDVKAWSQTLADIKAVFQLRKKLSYEGYPFGRLIKNQIGDGILNSAIAGLAIVAASADPLLAGILVWGTRTVEYGISVIWNQHMSSQRRQARLAAEGTEVENKLQCKWKAAKELVSSCKYDLVAGAATIAGVTLAVVGGPVSAIIGLGAVIAVCQTMSRFKEMSWSALRYIVNPNDELQKEVVNLQEPMSAYEMAINIGAMTLAYVAGFAAITAFYIFVPEVALPVSIVLGIIGTCMMVKAKSQFKQEEQQAKAALEKEQQWQASYNQVEKVFKSEYPDHGVSQRLEQLQQARAALVALSNTDCPIENNPSMEEAVEDIDRQIAEIKADQQQAMIQFLSEKENPFEKVTLKDWALEELALVYRASEEALDVAQQDLKRWLYAQDVELQRFYG